MRRTLLPAWAIIDRDLRKFFRSPTLLAVSLFLPLLQLIIIGYAFGGQVRNVPVALVALDRGDEAQRLREKFAAVEANARTFEVRLEDDLPDALKATRDGVVSATIVIPEDYSQRIAQRHRPNLGLVVDNTDPFVVAALTQRMNELVSAVNTPAVVGAARQDVALDVVELFPYVEYLEYLLPGTIALAVFVSALIGGGLLYIDDKARGFHEGYLVTPISTMQLSVGMVVSGTVKASITGTVVTFIGATIAGVVGRLTVEAVVLLLVLNTVFALSLITMVSLLMVRVNNPVVPRATFAIFNTLLFFPSGAMYPISSFPPWLQAVAAVDPFAYAVHGLRAVLLKGVGPEAIAGDLLFLGLFSVGCFTGMVLLFPRRL